MALNGSAELAAVAARLKLAGDAAICGCNCCVACGTARSR
jgi:hypothetical protein